MQRTLGIWLSLVVFWIGSGGAFAVPVKVGFAEVDVSPALGMERPGGYGKGFHTQFHDACKVRAVVFDDGTKTVALVGLDALFIMRDQVDAARRAIQERTGIPAESVLLGASHSHSSGPTGMILPGEFDDAEPWLKELAYEESSMADAKYLDQFVGGIVGAVVKAWETRAAQEVGVGRGLEETVSFNRRWRMKNGLTFTHPHYGNPDMVEPAGPIDPEVGVIGVWNDAGKLTGCVVNFACHATASPPGISANYIWYLEHVIRGAFGPDVVVVFLNGASGDVTQVDNSDPHVRLTGEADAMKVGGRIGAEAVKVLLDLRRTRELKVDTRSEVLLIPRRKIEAERLSRCRAIVQTKPKDAKAFNDWIWAKEIVLLDHYTKREPVREVEIQAIQVGPAVFLTTPAEYFCQFGLDQKKASPFPFTFPVSLANGCVGYVPTEEALGPHGGGYETRLTSYSNLIPTAGTLMRDTGIKLSQSLQPGVVPSGKALPPFTGGWQYGNVPPELK